HAPVGVHQGTGRRRGSYLFRSPGTEWPAGGSQDDAIDLFRMVGVEHLEDRAVFGIDRQKGGTGTLHFPCEEAARADEAFLVGKRHRRPGPYSGQGRFEAGGADDRRHHLVSRPARRLDDRFAAGRNLARKAGETFPQRVVTVGIGGNDDLRLEQPRLFGKQVDIAVADQCDQLEPVAIATHEIERAAADRSGGAEHREALRARRRADLHGAVHECHRLRPVPLSHQISRPAASSPAPARASPTSQAMTTTVMTASARSSIPPWPGMRLPVSLTPNLRLMPDSSMSPPCPTTAATTPSVATGSGDGSSATMAIR